MENQPIERGQGTLSAPGKRLHAAAPLKAAPLAANFDPQYKISPRKKRSWGPFAYVLFTIFVAYLAAVLAGAALFGFSMRSAIGKINIARAEAEKLEFKTAAATLDTARPDFTQAKYGLFLLNLIKPLPYIGNQVRAIDALTNASGEGVDILSRALIVGDNIISSADDLKSTLETQQNFSFYDLPPETRARILNAVATSANDLQDMRVRVQLALDDLAHIHDYGVAPQLLAVISPVEAMLPKIAESIDFLIPVTSVIRELGGVGADKQWLLMYLNNNELRPAGGFLGVYGFLLMRDGEIVNLAVEDVMKADAAVQDNPKYYIDPPQPIRDYMGVSSWYLRDANWSPDFKTSADTAVQLLRQEYAFANQPVPDIHGVIGVTPTVAERLLKYLGPITVDGITFDSENIRNLLEFQVEFGYADRGLAVDQRKAVVSHLTNAVIDRLTAMPLKDIPDVIDIFMQSFGDKQLALRSNDPTAQAAIENAKWGSVINPPKDGDTLIVVDANMAALKTDPVVDRQIKYTITPSGGRLKAHVDVTYIHKGEFSNVVSRYRTFTRVFVPSGSELIKVEGSMKNDQLHNPNNEAGYVLTENTLGMTSFGTFISIEPGRTGTLSFDYYLPDSLAKSIRDGKYNLQVYKQMGASDHALTLDLDFGKNLRTAEPPESRRNIGNTHYEYTGALSTDQLFQVRF